MSLSGHGLIVIPYHGSVNLLGGWAASRGFPVSHQILRIMFVCIISQPGLITRQIPLCALKLMASNPKSAKISKSIFQSQIFFIKSSLKIVIMFVGIISQSGSITNQISLRVLMSYYPKLAKLALFIL